jgi:hypothetical protein
VIDEEGRAVDVELIAFVGEFSDRARIQLPSPIPGEVRGVGQFEARLREAERVGFRARSCRRRRIGGSLARTASNGSGWTRSGRSGTFFLG